MKSRWIAVLFFLLFAVFVVDASRRHSAALLDPQFFQLESKLIYLILSSIAVGALLLFLLVAFFPPKSKSPIADLSATPMAKPTRKLAIVQTVLQLGDWEKALEILSGVHEEDPDFWQAKKIIGDMYAVKGQWGEASREYRSALGHCSGEAEALVLLCLGNVFEHQDQLDEAKDLYLQSYQRSPRSVELVQRLRNLAVREQDWGEAMRWQERKEHLAPEDTDSPQESNWKMGIRFELARSAANSGEYKTSQALLKYIFRMTDYFTPAILLQGEIQEKQQNALAGMKTYEAGFARTQNPAILKRLAERYLMENQPQRAIDSIREIVRNNPSDPRAAFLLGDLFRKLEMTTEARKAFEAIRQKHPDWLLNNIALAEILDREGEKEKALQLYKGIVNNAEALSAQPWQCYNCNTTYIDYTDFCVGCSEWNFVNLNQNKAGIMDFKYEKSAAFPV